jgi:hypothetical protein
MYPLILKARETMPEIHPGFVSLRDFRGSRFSM